MLKVYDDNFKFILKDRIDNGESLNMKCEFVNSQNTVYYETSNVRFEYSDVYDSIILFSMCDVTNATQPCYKINFKDISTNEVKYELTYDIPLPAYTYQIAQVVLNINTEDLKQLSFISLSHKIIYDIINQDLANIYLYLLINSLKNTPTNVPANELYGYITNIEINQNQINVFNDVRVKLDDGRIGYIVFDGENYWLEIPD